MNIVQFGKGKWGQNHFRILTEMGHDVTVVDLAGYKGFKGWHCDAAVVTCSSENHFPIVQEATMHGIPVFCEKPVCLTHEQLAWMFRERSGLKMFMAGHQLCFDPGIEAMVEKVKYMCSLRTGAIPRTEGALMSLAVHDIAMAVFVSGQCLFSVDEANGNDHCVKLKLSAPNGFVADIYCASMAFTRLRHTTFVGDDVFSFSPDNWARTDLVKRELEHFLSCVETGVPVKRNGIRETLIVMQTLLRAKEMLA